MAPIAAPEVIEPCSADGASPDDLDGLYRGGVKVEGALDPDLVCDTAHGESGARATASSPYNDSLKVLRPRAATLGHAHAHPNGIAGAEVFDPGIRLDLYQLLGFHVLTLGTAHRSTGAAGDQTMLTGVG